MWLDKFFLDDGVREWSDKELKDSIPDPQYNTDICHSKKKLSL